MRVPKGSGKRQNRHMRRCAVLTNARAAAEPILGSLVTRLGAPGLGSILVAANLWTFSASSLTHECANHVHKSSRKRLAISGSQVSDALEKSRSGRWSHTMA